MRKLKLENKYWKLGMTLFLVGLALILTWFAINNTGTLGKGFSVINDILFPFYLGIVLAYLLCPIYNWVVRRVYHNLEGRLAKNLHAYRVARASATILSVGLLIIAVSGFCLLIIPDLVTSIVGIAQNMPDTVRTVSNWIVAHLEENPQLAQFLQKYLASISTSFDNWLDNSLEAVEPLLNAVVSGAWVGIMGTFNAVLDVFVALIICVYVLNSKEIFLAQSKKVILALFKKERADSLFELGYLANKTFGGFINGKIIDSIIIGILCFIAMSVLKLPLATLVSVIVGITNVIPFFGPFIGAIPSIVLLLMVDPVAAIKFAVMVLVLQQLDGNIIGPKILGDSTGLASFWVMFAILMGGGLFGFVGMVLGVPCFALIYTYITRFINSRLKNKGLENDTVLYQKFDKYDINKEDIFGKERCNPDRGTAAEAPAGPAEPVEGK